MPGLTDLECERLILDACKLPDQWNLAYGITATRKRALLYGPDHSDSFFNPTSETALTVFMLGRMDQWEQSQLAARIRDCSPRNGQGWNQQFFQQFRQPWTRRSHFSSFLAERLTLDPSTVLDPFLLFEVDVFNNAFNGGEAVRNPSFLTVPGKWSRFDALEILPVAQTLLFIESKLGSDGTHGASGHDVQQPIRGLEAAFFLTTLPDSLYCGWKFRYVLLCPKGDCGPTKECERFFLGGYEDALDEYDGYITDNPSLICADRTEFRENWRMLRGRLNEHLAVVYWSEVMDELCRLGFEPKSYLQRLTTIDRHDNALAAATISRWEKAGLQV